MAVGFLLGLGFGILNYFVVKTLVFKLFKQGARKVRLGLLFALKMLCLLGVIAMCFGVFKVAVLPFVAGYAASLVVPVFGALFVGESKQQVV